MAALNHTTPGIQLTHMLQLAEAVDKNDDWTGLTDGAARRKRQNRLNVRAYRRRKATKPQAEDPPDSTLATPQLSGDQPNYHPPQPNGDQPSYYPHGSVSQPQIVCWIEDQQMVATFQAPVVRSLTSTKSALLPYLPSGQDPPTIPATMRIVFPLSSDHLITLVQYNVLRAFMTNVHMLRLLHIIPPECSVALCVLPASTNPPESIPEQFHPTALQRTVPHPSYIDAIPHPVWRDNLILAQGNYDEDDMCDDICGGLWDGFPDSECQLRGIVAWSTPWHASGWEISEGFFRKWGWVLKGCGDVLEATNRWRALRGEDPLVIEL